MNALIQRVSVGDAELLQASVGEEDSAVPLRRCNTLMVPSPNSSLNIEPNAYAGIVSRPSSPDTDCTSSSSSSGEENSIPDPFEMDISSEENEEEEILQDEGEPPDDEEQLQDSEGERDQQPEEGDDHLREGNEEPLPPAEDGEGIPAPDNNGNENLSHPKLRRKMQGDSNPIIDTQVNVSRSDALYMALGLAKRENFSHHTLCNSIRLINALFTFPILPGTVDSLDGLLLCNQYVNYFFYCMNCTKLFGELDYKNLKTHRCQNCNTVNVISDLRKAHFFVTFKLAHQLENLFQNPDLREALLSPREAVRQGREGCLADLWDGSVYKNFAGSVENFTGRVFSFHFCVDGSPLATSFKVSIWPLQVALNELPAKLRMSNLLLGGLWFGLKQAKMDLFISAFIDQFQAFAQGLNVKIGNNIERCLGFCIGCCVDSGARGKVQGIKTHSGYNSYNWCTICGQWIGGAVRFPLTDDKRDRTHQELERTQRHLIDNPQPEEDKEIEYAEDPGIPLEERGLLGVNSVSPLINLPHFRNPIGGTMPSFHMVDSFFVDSMHLLDLGVSKFFLTRWLEDYGHEYYIKPFEAEIDSRIKSLRPPVEFRRKPRPLFERARFTARECHNWMMYCCVLVLTGILINKYINCWLMLIQAIYLLDLSEVTVGKTNIAVMLINAFLTKTQEYYDEGDMTFNLHILLHLIAHVLRHGPLWVSSAYCFEDGNGKLKRLIHSNQGIPHQIIRALCWAEAMKILEGVVSEKANKYVADITQPAQHRKLSFAVGDVRLIGKPEALQLTEEDRFQCQQFEHAEENLERYARLVYKNCCFTDNLERSSVNNYSVAQLNDKSLILIRKILYDTEKNEVFLIVSNIYFDTVLVPPQGVLLERDDHFMRKINHINEEVRYINYSELRIICFRATMASGDFVAPLPNIHNRQ